MSVEWTIHTRNLRAGLMSWVRSLERVQEREADIRDLLRTVRKDVGENDLVALASVVSRTTKVPVEDIARVLGITLSAG